MSMLTDIPTVITPLSKELVGTYLRFASKAFGPNSYQSNPDYLRWLYEENPATRGISDALVAVRGSELVGCIHKMRMRWYLSGTIAEIPSLHNTMVLPNHRFGIGGLLIAKSLKGEKAVFVPGAVGEVADLLGRLGFRDAGATWRLSLTKPISAAISVIKKKMASKRLLFSGKMMRDASLSCVVNREVLASDVLCDEICGFLNHRGGNAMSDARHEWQRDMFRWRVLHPIGPAHVLCLCRDKAVINAAAILTVSYRKGLRLGRVVAWNAAPKALKRFLPIVLKEFDRLGAEVVIWGGGGKSDTILFEEMGWGKARLVPRSFFKSPAGGDITGCTFQPATGDYGLESINE